MIHDLTWPPGFADIVRARAVAARPAELDEEVAFADLGVDSVAFLGILADVEDAVGLEVDVEALTPEAFATPAGLRAWLLATCPASPQAAPAAVPATVPAPAPAVELDWTPVLPSKQIVFGQGHGAAVRSAADLILRVYRLDGELDTLRLLDCVARLIAANDALRLTFRDDGGTGYMRALDAGAPAVVACRQLVRWRDPDLVPYLRLLTRQVAGEWESTGGGSARWMLLRLAPARHLLATWYAHVSVDVRSVSDLERQLWAAYHGNAGALVDPATSFLDCARRRAQSPDRCAPAYWAREADRVASESWDSRALSPIREHRRRLGTAELAALKSAADGDRRLSVPQVIAHRFAAGVRGTTQANAIVLHHFVDERTPAERHVAGALSGLVPVVLGAPDLASPLASARRTVRALARRPRRPGGDLPPGYVRLLTAVRGYSFTYVPWRGNSVRPRFALEVAELPVELDVRDPTRGRLRVVELEHGGLELTLMVHPDETGEEEARAWLDVVGCPAR